MKIIAAPGVALVAVGCVLIVATAAVYRLARLGPMRVAPAAATRAIVQLTAVALVLAAALSRMWSSVVVLAVMFAAAMFTASRRSGAGRSGVWLGLSLAVGWAAVLPLLLVTGIVPPAGVAIVPIGGIILGGTMTATSLAARRALDAIGHRFGEVEAALSVGFTDRDAYLMVVRSTAEDALLPGVDQTRTAGLVTLPGAFVGVLLASGSAAQAAAVQVLVLLGLLLAQSCAVATTIELVARGYVHRRPRTQTDAPIA